MILKNLVAFAITFVVLAYMTRERMDTRGWMIVALYTAVATALAVALNLR